VTRITLASIVRAGPAAITDIGARLARGQVVLDCTGVDALLPEQLEFLLAAIPAQWDFVELGACIDPAMVSPQFAEQLAAWLDHRHGRAPELPPAMGQRPAEPAPTEESVLPNPELPTLNPAPYPAAALRDRLERLVISDILGPAGGPEEIIDERTVRGRYLVGMLAPRGSSGIPEEYDDADPGGADGEDGTTDAPASKAATAMLPSSIGLTFAVATDAGALCVTARWGRYTRVTIEDEHYRNPKGGYFSVWQRTPIDVTSPPIALKPGKIAPWSPYAETAEVTVQGLIRQRANQWIITLFLVNGQVEPKSRKDSAWLFQPEISITAPDGAPIFERRALPHEQHDLDEQLMAMLYRKQVEFAVGHGVAVDAEVARDAQEAPIFDRAVRVWTAVVPAYELPQTTPPQASDPGYEQLADLTVDMQTLAEVPDGQFAARLAPLAEAYATWIARQERRIGGQESGIRDQGSSESQNPQLGTRNPEPDLVPYIGAAQSALTACRQALDRIRVGIALLDANPQAAAAFRFANRAMALQRVHALYAAAVRRGAATTLDAFDTPDQHSWRAFQLGFILLNLPGLTDLCHPDRATPLDDPTASPAGAIADLLWFPTGGGKTEAYLGLTAYTLAIRRLQGVVAGHSGHAGVAVLMRYTLRLLTLQQFQRAATLICACEVIRRADSACWGSEPFRLGLWVGQRSTPNWVADADEAIKQLKKGGTASGGTPYQLKHCPWCGTPIEPGRDLSAELPEQGRARVLTYCGSLLSHCPFNARQSPGEGLPVLVVDEEIYHRLPALLIATVDKFAQMPWNGRTAMLFGRVSSYCERHGYLAPDVDHAAQSHPAYKRRDLPAAKVLPVEPLRPPDLIIQDELHLISGPLGTLVGLYETAVDQLASWEVAGMRVRPKVIASTATIRRAEQQVHSLFLRRVSIFPPQGLDASDSFFAIQRPPSDAAPGRRYLGICASGIRHKTALIQSYVAFLASAQQLYDELKNLEPDPWMTLVGYFNSLRELAAMRRAADDTVSTRLKKMDRRGLSRRFLDPWSVQELTSRLSAADIPEMLDRLETPFDPARKAVKGQRKAPSQYPIDVLLATNMISVGVDVGRLGLMVVGGQPKATAEYIQATSRVGRHHPGLVATVYNWARPRDLSHYERFKHYHATFYQYVEALSVTPFSPRALDRGLSAVLVALARLGVPEYNPNHGAARLVRTHPAVQAAVAQIVARASYVADEPRAELVRDALKTRLDQWAARIAQTVGARLGYKEQRDGSTVGLLQLPGGADWSLFACLNSLRDVEPTVNLVLDDGGLDGTTAHPWTFAEHPPVADIADEQEDERATL
jgi:hypothetical protein